jgi:hypothetical protein
MNVLKLALLGTAAVAAVSVSARADDLSDLKAQIEALNGRIATLESTPAVPAGFSLMTISEVDAIIVPSLDVDKEYGAKAHNIGIMPTADVPASTNIQWSGSVAAGIVYSKSKNKPTVSISSTETAPTIAATQTVGTASSKAFDVKAKARLKVVATTDTAVGEVGVRIAFQANADSTGGFNTNGKTVSDDGYWGWWKITPEMTLGAGVDGSLAGSGQGFDAKEGLVFLGDANGGYNHAGGDPAQIRLSYASGPLAFGIALEDGNNAANKSGLGVAGEVKYSGDMFGFELNAGMWDNKGGANTDFRDDNWTVNAGANIGLGDIATLSLAAGVGEDANLDSNLDRYTKISAHLGFVLSDAVTAELGASWKDYKGSKASKSVGAGLYYTPVSQLTLGVEAAYSTGVVSFRETAITDPAALAALPPAADNIIDKEVKSSTGIALVSVYRF